MSVIGPADWRPPGAWPALVAHEVHLWRVDLARSGDAIAAILSDDERGRLDAFGPALLRQRYAARRAAVRRILARYLDEDPARLVFRYTAHGKPELEPRAYPAGAPPHFSLAHSGDLAVLAVARGHAPGVDVERVRALERPDDLARTVFSPAEVAEYLALAAHEREAGFFNGWTRKEAWLKARGEGLAGDLAGFDVSLAPGARPRLCRVTDAPGEPGAWTLEAFVPLAGHVGAVAVRDPGCRVLAWQFAFAS